jgi:hypothetical protein
MRTEPAIWTAPEARRPRHRRRVGDRRFRFVSSDLDGRQLSISVPAPRPVIEEVFAMALRDPRYRTWGGVDLRGEWVPQSRRARIVEADDMPEAGHGPRIDHADGSR